MTIPLILASMNGSQAMLGWLLGATITGNRLHVAAGYGSLGEMPGNLLLAFEGEPPPAPGRRTTP